ncbi:MAG: hypothetical protein JWN34_1425 [Bryobacterales bacterium]|jgi:antitoxin VapB|nr:hypothetical protein [Bryobacterales bacterium]
MMTPIQIRNDDVVRDIRLLAELTGKSITEVVADSVRARLAEAQANKRGEMARKLAGIREIQRRVAALPNVGPLLTDDDLYDEHGLPK